MNPNRKPGRRASTVPERGAFVLLFCFAVVWALMASLGAAAERTERITMQLTSTVFVEGAPIPAKHTCDDKNVSPPLKWTGVPTGTRSLVLITDDPDAPVGTWVHWVLYDLPGTTTELGEDMPKTPTLPSGAKQGQNDFKRLGYGGPCPPPGKPHRYFLKLYALDASVDLKPGATKKEVEQVMGQRTILAQAQLMGTYQRR